jgi:serine/threonine protein kinase
VACVKENISSRDRVVSRGQAPPTGLADLEQYMRSTVNKEILRSLLEFGSELGAGEFGAVYEGFYIQPKPKLKVAIKMLKNCTSCCRLRCRCFIVILFCVCVCVCVFSCFVFCAFSWKQASHIGHCSRCAATSDEDKVRFLKEAAIMAQFNHPNICSLVGVCTLPATEPTLIVLEYMHLGALHGYLQSPMVKDQLETLTMLRMALDVASGMEYLAEAGFVVRWGVRARSPRDASSFGCLLHKSRSSTNPF